MAEAKTVNPQVDATPEDAERIGTLGAVLGNDLPEVVVGPVDLGVDTTQTGEPIATIRVNENIDEMSMVAGGVRQQYKFEVGHQYRVPYSVADELDRIGKLYH